MNTPILETERLILRPITLADAEEIFHNWTSDPDVARYMAYSTHENVGATQEWLRMVEANRGLPTNFDWGSRERVTAGSSAAAAYIIRKVRVCSSWVTTS